MIFGVGPFPPLCSGMVASVSTTAATASSTAGSVAAAVGTLSTTVTGKQALLTGSCASPAAITSIGANGAVTCATADPALATLSAGLSASVSSNTAARSALAASISSNTAALSTPCVFSVWSAWSRCSAACDGMQMRLRTVATQAVNAIPCTEFSLNESQSCSPPCPGLAPAATFDPCNGNEKWYNLNSGNIVRNLHPNFSVPAVRIGHSGLALPALVQKYSPSTGAGCRTFTSHRMSRRM